jgi:putative oxidoreductase
MSHAPSFTQPASVRRGRSGVIALWVVQIGLAGMFLLAGGSKLLGAPAMVALFNAIGIGQWFRYVTGLIEVGSALALLVPSIAVFGALALVPTMIAQSRRNSSSSETQPSRRRSCCSAQSASSGPAGINCSGRYRSRADSHGVTG